MSPLIYGEIYFSSDTSRFYSTYKFGPNYSNKTLHGITNFGFMKPWMYYNKNRTINMCSSHALEDPILSFKIIDPILQTDVENKCRLAKCSHLCLPSDEIQVFRCFCPQNYFLVNNKNCVENEIKDSELKEIDSQLLINHSINKSIDLSKQFNKIIEDIIHSNEIQSNSQREDHKMFIIIFSTLLIIIIVMVFIG